MGVGGNVDFQTVRWWCQWRGILNYELLGNSILGLGRRGMYMKRDEMMIPCIFDSKRVASVRLMREWSWENITGDMWYSTLMRYPMCI